MNPIKRLLKVLSNFLNPAPKESFEPKLLIHDIDAILEGRDVHPMTKGAGDAYAIAHTLHGLTDSDDLKRDNPWARLLPAEATCRAFCDFDGSMGNGFDTLAGYGGGLESFIRGHHALIAIGSSELLKITTEAKKVFEDHGISFPESIPQDWGSGEGIDWDLEQAIKPHMEPLNTRYWNCKEKGYELLLNYIKSDIESLRQRRKE